MFEHYEPEDRYDRDDDGLVINGENTYQEVANKLWEIRVHFVPWTDGAGSRYDLWLSFGGEQAGDMGNGLNTGTHLFMGVLAVGGAFGFDVTTGVKHASYVGEKLNLGSEASPTTEGLARLINGVASELSK